MSAIIIPMDKARTGRLLAQRASDLRMVARRLIAARRVAQLRAVDLCVGAGITSSQLANWESAKSRPRVDQLGLVLPFLEVTSDWIFFGDDAALPWERRTALLEELAKLDEEAAVAPGSFGNMLLTKSEKKG